MQTIDSATLRQWLEDGAPVAVLDVRTAADWSDWHIPGSIHVDAYSALKAHDPQALATVNLPRSTPVVTVCGAGKVSLVAAAQLAARGYVVYSLEGGMQAWSMAWNVASLPPLPNGTQVLQVRRTGKGCLSYIIGSAEQAAVLDPALEPDVYIELAAAHGWRITAVLDTHIHADHLSRARLLAQQVGASLYLPATERATAPFQPLDEGALVMIGESRLQALHTPGHTWESTCYLLDEQFLFTGDTLFLAAIGRPDLEADRLEATARAHALFASLQRLGSLPAATLVLPGHTSVPVPFDGQPLVACLGTIQPAIPRLRLSEAAFVADVLAQRPPTPANHQQIVGINARGDRLPTDLTTLEAGANRCAIA